MDKKSSLRCEVSALKKSTSIHTTIISSILLFFSGSGLYISYKLMTYLPAQRNIGDVILFIIDLLKWLGLIGGGTRDETSDLTSVHNVGAVFLVLFLIASIILSIILILNIKRYINSRKDYNERC